MNTRIRSALRVLMKTNAMIPSSTTIASTARTIRTIPPGDISRLRPPSSPELLVELISELSIEVLTEL